MVKVSGNSRSQSANLSPSSANDKPQLDKNQILVKKEIPFGPLRNESLAIRPAGVKSQP